MQPKKINKKQRFPYMKLLVLLVKLIFNNKTIQELEDELDLPSGTSFQS